MIDPHLSFIIELAQPSNPAQKCDAKEPCTTCIKSKSSSECVYDNRVQLLPESIPPSHTIPDGLPGQQPGDVDPVETSTSAPINAGMRSNTEMQLMPFREETPRPHQPSAEFFFSFHPCLRFPSIPRPLHIPWSYSAPERFQVSDTTSSELDFSLCVFPLFGYSTQASYELTPFDQPPCGATTIEKVWDSFHRSQAKCCNAWRYFKHRRSPILYSRSDWARDAFPYWDQKLTYGGPTARET